MCSWQCKVLDYDEDDDRIMADYVGHYKPSGDFSVYLQVGMSKYNDDGRSRIRVSLWNATETKGAEALLGALIDENHEVEVEVGRPTFLRFKPLEVAADDGMMTL